MAETWRAKPCGWSKRERVVDLGVEFGPAGPMVLDWLEERAKEANDGGCVRSGFRAVERGAFLVGGVEEAERIVRYAAQIAALDDLEVNGREFTCRISGFQQDQVRGRAADRQADKRARDAGTERDEPPPVTPRHAPSRPVTDDHASHATGQDRTEENNNDLESSTPVEPDRLDAARERAGIAQRVFAYWQQQCNHPTARFTRDRRAKIEARLREGYSEAQLCTAIDGAARAAFVNDQGKRFDDLELICRNGSKLEQFIARAAPQPPGVKFNAPRSGRWSATDFMEYGAELATEGDAA